MFKFLKPNEGTSSQSLKKRQRLYIAGGVLVGFAVLYLLLDMEESVTSSPPQEPITPPIPLEVVDEKERWVSRIEREARKALAAAEDSRKESSLLRQEMKHQQDVMDQLFQRQMEPQEEVISVESEIPLNQDTPPIQGFPVAPSSRLEQEEGVTVPRSSIGHLTNETDPLEPDDRPTVDGYIPAGTYSKSILMTGVVASTSTSTQSDPQPILMRLVDSGNLPRGFKGDIKDAVLIGACYGNLSSERAYCRLHKMSLTERNGEILEKDIEGWVIGEDGRPGLKGVVVDRAGEVAREALVSGILGGMASFMKSQSSNSVFPVSPFGQTNALKSEDLLKGGAANGAGNALEKLAEFSIKRAESMEPVILISAGRSVDVVFKEGVDLSESSVKKHLRRMGQDTRHKHAKQQAQTQNLQLQD